MNYLKLIGRNKELFVDDLSAKGKELDEVARKSTFLVIGGAGSIGRAVVKEIFRRDPKLLHVVDLSENNLVELVREIRSTVGYMSGEFKTFAIDCGSLEFELLIKNEVRYDYVLNLSALKHVRSEKDPYTLMRMIEVNIVNTLKTIKLAEEYGVKKYFCVSTDKAANPVNMMGASKRIMETFILEKNIKVPISTARFANVAFSDGSLLEGFINRFNQKQPLAAPDDVLRYFVTPKESGELCLMSCIFGKDKEIFFPKLNEELHLVSFKEIAYNFIESKGYKVLECKSEDEARMKCADIDISKHWPCFFSKSSTSGEKSFEEFYTDDEKIDLKSFTNIGVIQHSSVQETLVSYDEFKKRIDYHKEAGKWSKTDILKMFKEIIPNFSHIETGSDLDQKM